MRNTVKYFPISFLTAQTDTADIWPTNEVCFPGKTLKSCHLKTHTVPQNCLYKHQNSCRVHISDNDQII